MLKKVKHLRSALRLALEGNKDKDKVKEEDDEVGTAPSTSALSSHNAEVFIKTWVKRK
jgi:hypothetical protein